MTLYDMIDGKEYSLKDLKNDWAELRSEDPDSYPDNFRTELCEILLATVNGRNDNEIHGLTAQETSRFILALRKAIA